MKHSSIFNHSGAKRHYEEKASIINFGNAHRSGTISRLRWGKASRQANH